MRRGRVVSRAVRMKLCMKFARMAASMRGVVRRVSRGWRWVGGVSLGLGDRNPEVEDEEDEEDDRLDERLVPCGVPSGVLFWLLEHVPYVGVVSKLAFLGLGSRSIRRRKSSATSCTYSL